jgi:hypothetical protein
LAIISKFPQIANTQICSSKEKRDAIEKRIEEMLIEKSYLEAINEYKVILSGFSKPSPLMYYISELKKPDSSRYPCPELFRITKIADFNSMSQAFNSSDRKSDLKLLHLVLENYNEMQNLTLFWPLLNFSQTLLEKFNNNISRVDACKIQIKACIEDDLNLVTMFKQFISAWNKLNIEISFGCKKFDKIFLEETTPLACFLIDSNLNSLGICLTSALLSLAKIQNKVVKAYRKVEFESVYPIQSLANTDIADVSLDDDFIKTCATNSLKFDLGKELIYDFDKIQSRIELSLRKAKLLNEDFFTSVQYHFELLNSRSRNSGVINAIRQRIPQESLISFTRKTIEAAAKKRNLELKIEENVVYAENYKWLDKVLCRAQHLKEFEGCKVSSIRCERNKYILNEIGDLDLNYLISVYEFIEIKSYPVVVTFIIDEYKKKLDNKKQTKKEFELLFKVCSEKIKKDIRNELHNVVKRLAIRLLTSEIDSQEYIFAYLENENLWSEEYLDVCDSIIEEFPKELRVCELVSLEKVLRKIC